MSTITKKDVINMALAQIGIASYEFDVTPDEYNIALKMLDAMFSTWAGLGFWAGYLQCYDGDITEPMYIPDVYFEAAYTNLAIRLAPSYGTIPSPQLAAVANQSYSMLMQQAAMIPVQVFGPTTPVGSGNEQRVGGGLISPFFGIGYPQRNNQFVNGFKTVPNFISGLE